MSIRFIRHDNFGGNYVTIYRFVSEISVHPRLPKKVKNVARILKNFINDSKINPKQYNLSMQRSGDIVRLMLLNRGQIPSSGRFPQPGEPENIATLKITASINRYKQAIRAMVANAELKQQDQLKQGSIVG